MTQMAIYIALGFVLLGMGLVAIAWSHNTGKVTCLPDWFPLVSGIGMVTVTLILWQVYHDMDSGIEESILNFSLKNAHDALLLFGLLLSGVLALTVHYNQTAQQRLLRLQREEEKSQKLIQTKNVLNALLQSATEPHSFDQLLEIAMDHILTGTWIATLRKGAVFLYDEDSDALVLRFQKDLDASLLKTCARVASGECLCGLVLKTRQVVFSDASDSRHTKSYKGMQPHSHYCVPIHSGNRLLGVFNVYLPAGHVRNAQEEEFFKIVANTLSGIIVYKQHDAKMLEKTAFINSILNSSPDLAIAATDLDFRITYYNDKAEEIFNHTKAQAIGQTVQSIHTRERVDAGRFDRAVEIVRREGIYRYVVNQSKNGQTRIISSKVSGILNQNNEIIGFVLVSQDITDQKQMEFDLRVAKERAEESTMAKSAFLATMSHEIRTPMNAILGMGEVLKDSGLNQEQSEFLQVLTNAGRNLLALINDILDLSKVEAGQLAIESLSFDLREFVEGTHRILLKAALDKELVFNFHIQKACPNLVVGDPERIRQVLLNLIGNAIKFTQRGSITLLVAPLQQDFISFTLSDTGIGIPANRIGLVFEPFKQADESISRRFGGTGLGLSICKQLVEAMGGTISVESEVGKGTVFRFVIRLPRSVGIIADPELARIPLHVDSDPQLLQPLTERVMKILLVDDAEDNHLVIHAFLRKTPHQLVDVVNGEEGVRRFKAESFDLVLMDMQMPVLDGFNATRQMRQWELEQGLSSVPIVALTANAMKEDMEKTAEVGCNLHLSKPLRKAHLFDVINRFSQEKTSGG